MLILQFYLKYKIKLKYQKKKVFSNWKESSESIEKDRWKKFSE